MTTDSSRAINRATINAVAIAMSTFLGRGIQFAWILVLSRLLGATDFGIYGTIGGMIAMAAVLPEFGTGLIVMREVAQNPSNARKYLSATLILQMPLAILSLGLLVGASFLAPYDWGTRLLTCLAGISLITDALGNVYYSQLVAAERMTSTSIIMIVHISLTIAFVFAGVISGGGLPALYIGTILAGIFRAVLHWIAAQRIRIHTVWPVQFVIVRHLLKEGWPLAVGAFLKLAYQNLDKVIVLATIGEKEAGYLTAAFVVVFGVTELLNTTVLIALFPVMSRIVREQPAQLQNLVDDLCLITLVLALPIVILISQLSPRLAALLFPGFTGTASVLEVLIWHTLVAMVANLYAQQLIIQAKQRSVLLIRTIALILNIVLNLLLLPRFGVPGTAIAAFVAETLTVILLILQRSPSSKEIRHLTGQTIRILLAGFGMLLMMSYTKEFNVIVSGIAGCAIYCILSVQFRTLSTSEQMLLMRILDAIPIFRQILSRFRNTGN